MFRLEMKKSNSFTLIELLLVVAVVITLAAIAIPSYNKAKNRAIAKEAISNLKLISAAERIYRMETDNNPYASCSCINASDCVSGSGCNNVLKLMLNTTNWQYTVITNPPPSPSFSATATYVANSSCLYSASSWDFNADPLKGGGASCP